MKTYMFYTKAKYVSMEFMHLSNVYDPEKVILYAWTVDKGTRDAFIESRDMSKFIYKKVEIDDNIKKEFTFININSELHVVEAVYDVDNYCTVVMNRFEQNDTYYLDFQEWLCDLCETPYNIFNDKYIKALDILLYASLNCIFYTDDDTYRDLVTESLDSGYSVCGFLNQGYRTNQTAVFVNKFKNLLK